MRTGQAPRLRAPGVWVQVAAVVTGVPLAFFALQGGFRHLEALATQALVRLLAGGAAVPYLHASTILVNPAHFASFSVVITKSCSVLPSVLALGALVALVPQRLAHGRRGRAFLAAAVAVTVGNLLRMGGSIVVGLFAGPVVLVLFHDWAGSIFGFAYTLLGFSLMLWTMFPAPVPVPVAAAAG